MVHSQEIQLFVTQNVEYTRDIEIKSIENPALPFNLTGFSATMFIAKYYDSVTRYSVPVLIPNPLNGILRISISAESTRIIPSGAMVYSLFVQNPTSANIIVIKGPISIIPTVGA